MSLLIDDREDALRVEAVQKKIPGSVVKRLEVGDYQYGELCIEVKEIGDLIGSVVDGKLFRQLHDTAHNFKYPILAVIGPDIETHLKQLKLSVTKFKYMAWPKWGAISGGMRERYYSALDTIAKNRAVGILHFPDNAGFAEWLKRSISRLEAPYREHSRSIETSKSADRDPLAQADDMLCAVTGIGRKASGALLAHSIAEMAQQSPETLREWGARGETSNALYAALRARKEASP